MKSFAGEAPLVCCKSKCKALQFKFFLLSTYRLIPGETPWDRPPPPFAYQRPAEGLEPLFGKIPGEDCVSRNHKCDIELWVSCLACIPQSEGWDFGFNQSEACGQI